MPQTTAGRAFAELDLGLLDHAAETAIKRGSAGGLKIIGYGDVTLVIAWAKDEAERNRLIQRYIADTGAHATIKSAGINAGASMYSADVQRMLGLAGLDVDREQNYFSNNLDYQRLMLQYPQMISGMSPDTILGGNPIPGGDTTVT